MTTIVTRAGKGSALTWTEGDANITNLNTAKLENVVEDTTPQLGGNLDVLNFSLTNSNVLGVRIDVTGDHLRLAGGAITTPNNTTALSLTTNVGSGGSIYIPGAANGAIEIIPNGTGNVLLTADTVMVGDSGAAAIITTNGAGNLTLSTNDGTNSGTIAITQGANANITVTPNGTGLFFLQGQTVGNRTNNTGGVIVGRAATTTGGAFQYPSFMVQKNRTDITTASMTSEPANIGFSVRDSASVNTTFARFGSVYQGTGSNPYFDFKVSTDGFTTTVQAATIGAGTGVWGATNSAYTHTTNGTGNLTLSTNSGTNSGTIVITQGVNGNIALAPNGTGRVAITNPLRLASYTAAALTALTGAVGDIAAVTNSAGGSHPNGMIAYWDTTNSRWSYMHDNSAV